MAGVDTSAGSTSSNPSTEQSSGTRKPASVSPRTTPRALRSSKAITAVNGQPDCSICFDKRNPPSKPEIASTSLRQLKHQPRIQLNAGFGRGALHPCPAWLGIEKLLRAAYDRDLSVPEFAEMAHRQRASRFVVDEDRTDSPLRQIPAHNNDWDVVFLDIGQQVSLFEDPTRDHDDAFGAPLENHLQIAVKELALGLRVHQQRQIVGGKSRLYSAHYRSAERISQVVGENADGLAAATAERTRESVRMVAKLARHCPDLLARGGRYILRERRFAQHNGDGRH